MLTQKQENFTLNLFKGMSQRDAYINAGYSDTQLPATLDNNAYDLANNTEIVARLEELNKPKVDDAISTFNERLKRLTVFEREDIENKEFNPVRTSNIQAIAEHNKMTKVYTEGSTINVVLIKEVEVRLS